MLEKKLVPVKSPWSQSSGKKRESMVRKIFEKDGF